jgi:hypothetical protein
MARCFRLGKVVGLFPGGWYAGGHEAAFAGVLIWSANWLKWT